MALAAAFIGNNVGLAPTKRKQPPLRRMDRASMRILRNPLKGQGLPDELGLAHGEIETSAQAARALYAHCPVAHSTPLVDCAGIAAELGIASLLIKDERARMGLGSFKALGAAHAIAKQAAKSGDVEDANSMAGALAGQTFICASAGNHGLSVAVGARIFGARSVVYLAETVPGDFADRLREKGAEVVVEGADYEESMNAAQKAADDNGWFLLSDSSWEGYSDPSRDVMEGYLIMSHEMADQMKSPPTHVFLQAGVGGLAAAGAAGARSHWGDDVTIIVVEPEFAPALIDSIVAGTSVDTVGPVSTMGRLDCKTPSHLALKYLAKEADYFVTISDEAVDNSLDYFAGHGIETSPSGGAGLAFLQQCNRADVGIDADSRVLCIVSEGK